ncbi:hypothetical protein GCM10009839_07800 [Catenulispora yoronensis]|uniref:Bacterial transcriptional activator domain-containing protein n=1 Tax=Catenulispora yoronensis TaxID=450799 RepID=A0ABN2TNB2_9ACTN
MSSSARLRLLDGFALEAGTRQVHLSKTLQRLVAFVALRRRATRSLVVGTLWPDSDEAKACGRLRTALWRLQQCGAPLLVASGETLRLHETVWVDVDQLFGPGGLGDAAAAEFGIGARHPDGRVGAGGYAGVSGGSGASGLSGTPAASGTAAAFDPFDVLDSHTLLRSCGLGELLPGWYEDWVLLERERLRQRFLHSIEDVARRELRAGNFATALEAVLLALRSEPLRESPHRLMLEIHLAEGNYSEAVHTYHAYRILLCRELGVSPSPGMRRLLEAAMGPLPGVEGPARQRLAERTEHDRVHTLVGEPASRPGHTDAAPDRVGAGRAGLTRPLDRPRYPSEPGSPVRP